MDKNAFKSLIALRQSEIPFDVFPRDSELPLDRGKIITVPGVRRCGKSSMMMLAINALVEKQSFDKRRVLWIGFDDERLRVMTSYQLNLIVDAYMEMFPDIPIKDAYLFFDEIQLVPGWEYFVMRLYKNYCRNIYISGSNATMLSSELKSVLRGWPLEYEAWPLSFREYCRFKGVDVGSYLEQDTAMVRNSFQDYNRYGAFPEVVLTKNRSEQTKLLQGYFDTMLLNDLAEHYHISNIPVLRYFLKRIMSNLSKPTSILAIYNDIKSQGLKISKDDLYQWADYACSIFMFVRVPKYERSLAKEQRSQCKYYCIDNGLRNSVLLPQSGDDGKLLGNTVLLHLRRTMQPFEKVSYYLGKTECDFVLQREDAVSELFQVCWSISSPETRNREIAGLLEASEVTGCDNLTIVTNDEESEILDGGKIIRVVPAWKLLLK